MNKVNEEVATENVDNIEIIDGVLKTPWTWKEVTVVSKTLLSCSVPKKIVPVIRNKIGRSVVKLLQIKLSDVESSDYENIADYYVDQEISEQLKRKYHGSSPVRHVEKGIVERKTRTTTVI